MHCLCCKKTFENQKQIATLVNVSLRMEKNEVLEKMQVSDRVSEKKQHPILLLCLFVLFFIKPPIHRWNLTVLLWTNELPIALNF